MSDLFDSVAEYNSPGNDNVILKIQILATNIRAFFLEFRRCNGLTIATYLKYNEKQFLLYYLMLVSFTYFVPFVAIQYVQYIHVNETHLSKLIATNVNTDAVTVALPMKLFTEQ